MDLPERNPYSPTVRHVTQSVFSQNSWRDMSTILDGTSNTIMVTDKSSVVNLSARETITGDLHCDEAYNPFIWEAHNGSGFTVCTISNVCNIPPNPGILAQHQQYRGARSFHAGGVNVALFDGSVRFISNTVSCGGTTANIWVKLFTINQGESIEL